MKNYREEYINQVYLLAIFFCFAIFQSGHADIEVAENCSNQSGKPAKDSVWGILCCGNSQG